jgi:hypothetical protein
MYTSLHLQWARHGTEQEQEQEQGSSIATATPDAWPWRLSASPIGA